MRDPLYVPRPVRRPDGRAVVRLNGHDHYLGQAGEWPKSKKAPPPSIQAEHQALIGRWLANGRVLHKPGADSTVNDVLLAYDKFAVAYYHRDGKEETHLGMVRDALRVVKELYGRTPAAEFGPKKLREVQAAMARKGWSRNYVNAQVDRVRRAFKWAVAEELVPGDLHHALLAVSGLRKGVPGVRETARVKPVPDAAVEAVLPFLPPPIRAIVRLQRLTGMRPGEACLMRAIDIDVTGRVWVYRPAAHKTEHLDKAREVYIGPKAQEVLRTWLTLDTHAYLFSPAAAEADRNAQRRQNRRTPMTPSQARRKPCRKPRRPRRDRYDETSVRNAVYRACDRAFPAPEPLARRKDETVAEWAERLSPAQKEDLTCWRKEHRWHPNRLRHNAGTAIRREHGIELARIVLGHSTAFTTEIYAEADRRQAMDVVARLG